jgi:predicted transposase YdaD
MQAAILGRYNFTMRADHDSSYRRLFAHPELVCELLAACLPFAWASKLNAEGCRRVNASYASDGGQQRHDDMVWRVQSVGGPAELYVLLEFQSRPDRCMALRMQVYTGLLLEDLHKQRLLPAGRPFPKLLPLVLYAGARPWTSAVTMLDLQDQDGELDEYQPQQRYLLLDLARCALRSQHNDGLRRTITLWVKRYLRRRFKKIKIPGNCSLEEVRTM